MSQFSTKRCSQFFAGFIAVILLLIWLPKMGLAQEQNYSIDLTRGKLWQTLYISQEAEPMSGDWSRKTYGLDWPGYSTEELKENIGGSNSYILAGGFYLMALTDSGTTMGWADFATHGREVDWSGDQNKYLVTRHERRWKHGENYWLATDPYDAEEEVITDWMINGAWYQPIDNQNIPVSITRKVRQWSGSQADENYLITEFTIRNEQRRNPLDGVYLLFSWALSPNHRGWNLLYPNLPDGARNTESRYDQGQRMLVSWAGDYTESGDRDETYDYFEHAEYDAITDQTRFQPEFVAPGYHGIKFLYISPDSTGQENHINGFVWSAASPSNDAGPFEEVQGLDNKYRAMANPLNLTRAFDDSNDTRMGQNRLYANFSLGPFNIDRRDSIKIVLAEFVGGMSYKKALDLNTTKAMVAAAGDSAVEYLNQRIEFNYEHNYTVPMSPPAPKFAVRTLETEGSVGNKITFSDSVESIPDPHQGEVDIAGYRIYRSGTMPFGPWDLIQDIPVGDTQFYNADSGFYTYIDTSVALGYGYYYSLTSYDAGHDAWAVDPSVSVPPLESSIFANRMKQPFRTTLWPTERSVSDIAVVPNPFYRSSGFELAGESKIIQFVNLPSVCTIRIFTVRGDLVKTIKHNDLGSGVATWNQISDFGQYVKSGMYFYHVENARGDVQMGKFAIIN